jgi:hypothetical protein
MISQKHLHDLFIYAGRTFDYDPDVWGDSIEEAVARVRDGYVVPYPLVKKLVQHAAAMQTAMLSMDTAVEARMTDLDEREKLLPSKKVRPRGGTLLGMKPKKPQEEKK